MKFSSAFLVALPLVLTAWTATATPRKGQRQASPVEDRDLARLTASKLAARHAAEWDIFERDFEPETLEARRACHSSRDCLGMICINGTCQ